MNCKYENVNDVLPLWISAIIHVMTLDYGQCTCGGEIMTNQYSKRPQNSYNEKASLAGRSNGSLFEYADKLLPYQAALVQLSNLHFFLGSSLIPCIKMR